MSVEIEQIDFVWEGKEFTTFFAGEEKKQVEELIPIPNENADQLSRPIS